MSLKLLYRALHSAHLAGVNSRGGFQSGLARSADPSSYSVTLGQHANGLNRDPTPWILTTDQLLRAILHAVKLAEVHETAGVGIAIIAVSKCKVNPPTKTSELRFRHQLRYEAWNHHEFLFRWESLLFSCYLYRAIRRSVEIVTPSKLTAWLNDNEPKDKGFPTYYFVLSSSPSEGNPENQWEITSVTFIGSAATENDTIGLNLDIHTTNCRIA